MIRSGVRRASSLLSCGFQSVFGLRRVHCCGIVAYIGPKDASHILSEGVQILQNRGYDSCGMATLSSEQPARMVISKFASRGSTSDCIELLSRVATERHLGHHIGIAHTRWATHGAKTDINAHPHTDMHEKISVVHNGTIDNYSIIKESLLAKQYKFKTETDTEVIANLIGAKLQEDECDLETAVASAVDMLEGTWGLAVLHKDHPDQIICARNGSPLLVGCSDNEVFVASETAPLARYINHFMALKDGEICKLSRHGIDHLVATGEFHEIHHELVATTPDPYEHWTLKEIYEQPKSLSRALNYGGRISPIGNVVKLGGLDCNKAALLEVHHMLIAGCGTSYHAGMYGEKLFHYLQSFATVRAVDASELDENALPPKNGGILLLSQSGETLDTFRAAEMGERHNLRLISVVNVVGSLLARTTGCGVYLNSGREVGVASTKAFTSQVIVLSLIGTWFTQKRELNGERCRTLMDAVHRVPVYVGMTLECRTKCKKIAENIKNARTMFILGKGFGHPVALEAALKIKEIAYIHAEGFPTSALKHGPFALLDPEENTPVILIAPTDSNSNLIASTAEQLKARKAHLIVISDNPSCLSSLADDIIVVPPNGPLTALMCVIPLQLLAYELAVAK